MLNKTTLIPCIQNYLLLLNMSKNHPLPLTRWKLTQKDWGVCILRRPGVMPSLMESTSMLMMWVASWKRYIQTVNFLFVGKDFLMNIQTEMNVQMNALQQKVCWMSLSLVPTNLDWMLACIGVWWNVVRWRQHDELLLRSAYYQQAKKCVHISIPVAWELENCEFSWIACQGECQVIVIILVSA